MTPLQQAYLDKLYATAKANLEFFRLNAPAIYQRVTQASPLPTLDISDQGDLALRYPDGSIKAIAPYLVEMEARFKEFANPQTRPQLLAFHELYAVAEAPSHGDMQRYHYSNIDAEFPNRARRHFAKHYPNLTGLARHPTFGAPSAIPLLLVLGSGVGGHLTRLVLEYELRYLIVLEQDEDAFRVSLFFQDYLELSRLAMEKGTDLAFIVGPNIDHLTLGLMGVLRKTLPPFFVHGAALFYAMPEGAALEEIKECITRTLWQVYFGLGYFDDELICIKHTLRNLAKRWPLYQKPLVVDSQAVACIIGSGPSLDGLLPFLRQHRQQAVLFSCGTALGPLAHAGIVPDFHVEKERPGLVYEVLTRTLPPGFTKQVNFIGLNVVLPEVFELFGWAGMVMKETDTMTTLLQALGTVPRVPIDSQPTVTNMALSLALTLGFRHIYLIGVDMGYRHQERHHAEHTAYLAKLPEAEHLRRLLNRRPVGYRRLPANFGGEAYTDPILDVARLYMENTIRVCPHAQIYNLNDGVLIEGAKPLQPEDFPGLGEVADKDAVLAALFGAFSAVGSVPSQLGEALLASIDKMIAALGDIFAQACASRADVLAVIVTAYRYLQDKEVKTMASHALLSGTVLNLLSLCYSAISIIHAEDEAVAKAQYDFMNVLDALAAARAEVARVLAEQTIPCLGETHAY